MRRLALPFVIAAALGCGDDDQQVEKQTEPPPPAIDATVTFDRSSFCGEVFPAAEVSKVLATPLQAAELPSRGARVACRLRSSPDAGDEVRVTLRVDCTERSGRYSQRELVEAMRHEEMGSEYTDVELGNGGGKIYHPRFRSWFLSFNHGQLPCAVNIETEYHPRDQLDRLAELVLARLTSSNRPR